jgi:aryl-phospho-beta-D-glucosidase BglC (GH1 family)
MICVPNFGQIIGKLRLVLQLLAIGLAGVLHAQTFTDIGAAAPSPGTNDIFQLSTRGNQTWPNGLNYFTDNNPPVGQTFTTGTNAMSLVSVAIKTAGLNSGNGYGTPASTPTYYLRIYSMSGSNATLLNTFKAPNPGFTDGDWLQWSRLNVPLATNKTYAFSFGIQPTGGGWAALAVATNALAGGEIAIIPITGGTITTGSSHSFDAVFALGLRATTNSSVATPLPNPTYGWNLGNTLEPLCGAGCWGPLPTQALINSAANAGFNAIRIPCAWDSNANQTNYQINPTYMSQVKQVVDWSIAAGMYVVINDHWDGGWLDSNIGTTVNPTINAKVNSYWTQIATTFSGYGNYLLFAAANEPSVSSPAAMNTLMVYYQTFVNAVRGVGGNNTNRWLVLQGGGDTSWLNSLPTDSTPNRLMVEYHCYTPFQFTQLSSDASWGNMQYFWGPAYHYSGDPTRNATSPEEGYIDLGFQQLTDQYVSKGIPVMVGEFQAAGKSFLTGTEATYNSASAHYWNKYLVDSAHVHGLSPFYWSTPGSPFDWTTGAITDQQVVTALTGGIAPPPPNGTPYAASGLTATAGNGQATLSWTAGSGATSYNLYRAAESGYESPIAPFVTGITNTSYTDTNLNSGITYYYQVVAVNGSGPSGFSPEAHATTSGVNPDPAQFNFETDPQGWAASGSQIAGVATSTAQHFAGRQSLAVNFNGTAAGTSSVYVGNMGENLVVTAGTTITFRVWIPSGSKITTLQPYLQDYNWAWTSSFYGSLTANAWNTITLTVPSTAITPLQQLGIQFTTSAAWTGTCYIDSVAWNTPPTLVPIANQTVNVGQTVAFTASATDADQPPQTLTFALLAGATNATLNTNSGAFSFRPLVTQANSTNGFTLKVSDNGSPPLGATQSLSVIVNPLSAPGISNISFTGGQFSFKVSGQSGPDYAIEISTNLTQWSNVFTANSPVLPFNWTDTNFVAPQRFYRVKLGPPLP